MAPVAGKVYAGETPNAIVCDMGGTSFDVSVIRDGYIKFTRETWLGGMFTGHMTGLSSVDVKSIGAGGGSIAWIDSGGPPARRAGERRSGPGPGLLRPRRRRADRDRRGRRPRLHRPGLLPRRPDRARSGAGARRRSRRRSPSRSGWTPEQAAYAILAVANEHMVTAIRDITINEGLDPRDSVVVAGGGAGGLDDRAHRRGARLRPGARAADGGGALGLRRPVLRRRHRVQHQPARRHEPLRPRRVNAGLGAARAPDGRVLRSARDRRQPARRKEFFVEARYPYQVWELEVPLRRAAARERGRRRARWSTTSTSSTSASSPSRSPASTSSASTGRVARPRCSPSRSSAGSSRTGPTPSPPDSRRRALVRPPDAPVEAAVYLGDVPGRRPSRLDGPAIVEEPTTTVVVYPGWSATVTTSGDYLPRARRTR